MKVHPREAKITMARIAVEEALNRVHLTYGERQAILAGILAQDAKYVIREERSGEET